MAGTVYIPSQFVSRYSLLGAMAGELGEAFTDEGWRVNPERHDAASPAIFLLLNFPANLEQFLQWMHSRTAGSPAAIVHFYVDHPLGLHTPHIDVLSKLPHYRLLMPCRDDAHLLRLRWPGLRHMACYHGVPESSLCDLHTLGDSHLAPPDEAGARDIPILAAGSIHTENELDAMRTRLPRPLWEMCDTIAGMQTDDPAMSFTQAFDMALPPGMISPDHWQFMAGIWAYTTAELNRRRRTALIQAMQGLPTLVVGSRAWRDVCTGTITYGGEVAYADLPALMRRTRVCLAWGPTQFVHTFSERPLLAMAAGCATLTDDRLLSRAEFSNEDAPAVTLYSAAQAQRARELAESYLDEPRYSASLAARGRALVAGQHLWKHRVATIIAAGMDALR